MTHRWKNAKFVYLSLILLGVSMVFLAASLPATGGEPSKYSAVRLPEDYAQNLVHYATVQRIDGTIRNLYVTQNGVERLAMGQYPLPDRTVIVIEGFYAQQDNDGNYQTDENGHYLKGEPFEMVHVLEKRTDWRDADFVVENRIGQWNFGSFDGQAGHFDEEMSACFNCHNATSRTDFLYTYPLLREYARTQQLQYLVCNLPDRIAC
jgi:hypothetical protein